MSKKVVKVSLLFLLISILLSTAVSMYSLYIMANDNQKDINVLLAARIHDKINSKLAEPIIVSKTMANSRFLLDFLQDEENIDINEMKKYLKSLKTGLAYDSVFVVSDKTKKYYTYEGVKKTIDLNHDIWYSTFLNKSKLYDLDIDIDRANKNIWTIFSNVKIYENDKFLGVCGVGIKINNIQNIICEYEKQYNVKINLVDTDGLVQVDTDEINIENAYLDDPNTSVKNSNEYAYQKRKGREYTITKYLENLGWYLVIESKQKPMDKAFVYVFLLNFGLFSLVALTLTIANHFIQRHTHMLMTSSYFDQLTGIHNRRAYEEILSQLSKEKLKDNLLYVNVDVNGLKKVNDMSGHTAGDELIKGAAECLQKVFGNYGHVFRIGGDEFAAILYVSPKDYEKVKKALQDKVDNWHGLLVNELSISVGYVPRWEFKTSSLDEMIQESDKRMYFAKEEYYKRAVQKETCEKA